MRDGRKVRGPRDDDLAAAIANAVYDAVGVRIRDAVRGTDTVARLGGALKILKPSRRIQDSLSLMQLLPIFEIHEDEDSAVASFG